MDADAIHELTAAYALDALDEAEVREYEAHLALCAPCREELSSFSEVTTALAYGAEAPEPLPALRVRILEQARSERENVVPLRPRRWSGPSVAVASAAAAAALGFALWGSSLSRSLESERAASRDSARVVSILAQPDARRVALANVNGTLVVSRSGEGALVLSRLEPAPKGKTYEAWVIEGGRPKPAGLFDGGRSLAIPLERPVPDGALVAVTLEPAEGSDEPTGDQVFRSATA